MKDEVFLFFFLNSNAPKFNTETGLGGTCRGAPPRRRVSILMHSTSKRRSAEGDWGLFVRAEIPVMDYRCEEEASRGEAFCPASAARLKDVRR